ncbi:MAG: heavy-metal-associated domain-containing protein [Thermoanaerobaculia bacterium]
MKRFAWILSVSAALVAVVTFTSALPCCSIPGIAYAKENPPVATARLHIEGMTCGACAASVRIVLGKVEGVSAARVSHEEKIAVVAYDKAKITPQQLADTVNAHLPYKATVIPDVKEKP